MHYCALPTATTSVAQLLAVADDAVTCTSLGAVDIGLALAPVPPMSLEQGLLLSVVCVTVWGLGYTVKKAKKTINHA